MSTDYEPPVRVVENLFCFVNTLSGTLHACSVPDSWCDEKYDLIIIIHSIAEVLKVKQFKNEFQKSLFLLKYEQEIYKISAKIILISFVLQGGEFVQTSVPSLSLCLSYILTSFLSLYLQGPRIVSTRLSVSESCIWTVPNGSTLGTIHLLRNHF